MLPDFFIIYGEEYIRITSAVEHVNLLHKNDALSQFFNPDSVSIYFIVSLCVQC